MRQLSLAFYVCTVFVLTACLGGCSSSTTEPVATDPTLGLGEEELRAAPSRVIIEGRKYYIESFLWRDFMPGPDPRDQSLRAVVRAVQQNGEPLAAGFDLFHLWVFWEDQLWSTSFTSDERPPTPPNVVEKMATGGPEWPTESNVLVVAGVVGRDGQLRLVSADNQTIEATY